MEKTKEEFHQIEKILEGGKASCADDKSHEDDLRRMLLNSDCYSQKFSVRWKSRLGIEGITLEFASATFLAGFFLAFLFYFANSGTLPDEVNYASVSKNSGAQALLQTLYDEGRLKLKEEKTDGTRIYVLRIDDTSEVEIHDLSPYRIGLAGAHK